MAKSQVAVLRVTPETILPDIDRLIGLAGVDRALAAGKTTILKDNISWHFPFPAANTTPWQLEGTARSLRARGYDELGHIVEFFGVAPHGGRVSHATAAHAR